LIKPLEFLEKRHVDYEILDVLALRLLNAFQTAM